jgi:hypothetical protein
MIVHDPSVKQNPSEYRCPTCPGLKFPRYFVRYRSRYKHIASTHRVHGCSVLRRCRKADSRSMVAWYAAFDTEIWTVTSGSPHVYERASYCGACFWRHGQCRGRRDQAADQARGLQAEYLIRSHSEGYAGILE